MQCPGASTKNLPQARSVRSAHSSGTGLPNAAASFPDAKFCPSRHPVAEGGRPYPRPVSPDAYAQSISPRRSHVEEALEGGAQTR